jgi:hypothetical protein
MSVCLFIHQRLVCVLTVDVNQKLTQFIALLSGAGNTIDGRFASTLAGDDTAQNQIVIAVEMMLCQPRLRMC